GMGKDGLEGSRSLAERGATIFAQDEASSVVWGMPGFVAREGLAHEILPLEDIGPRIGEIVQLRALSRPRTSA
ncbi:MAG: chemotaxis response regulator protein-glutamate methylesterase, partial [Myxococcales bacterium]|nr:chemotaxis response regulator protein-glutamate methylesterase [Myxococcales bacterium]